MPDDELTVNLFDDLSDAAHDHDVSRKLGDYKQTNVPLSKFAIDQDEARGSESEGWTPRTTENIGNSTPQPEKPSQP